MRYFVRRFLTCQAGKNYGHPKLVKVSTNFGEATHAQNTAKPRVDYQANIALCPRNHAHACKTNSVLRSNSEVRLFLARAATYGQITNSLFTPFRKTNTYSRLPLYSLIRQIGTESQVLGFKLTFPLTHPTCIIKTHNFL